MCEGYWDGKLGRWVALEELEDEELDALIGAEVKLPTLPVEPKRKPAAILR